MRSMNQSDAQGARWVFAVSRTLGILLLMFCALGVAHAQSNGANKTAAPMAPVNGIVTVSMTLSPASTPNYVAPASVAVSISADDSYVGGSVVEIDLYKNGTLVQTVSDDILNATLTGLSAGTYTIMAVAKSDHATSGSKSQTITITAPPQPPPTVSLTTSGNNVAPATIALTAAATAGSGGSISKVDFYNGSTLLGTVTASPYTFNWSGVAAGTYSLTAKATDNLGQATTSSSVAVQVTAPSPSDAATFISQSVPSTLLLGQTASVTVQMRNDGSATWTSANGYNLGSQSPANNTTWGTAQAALPASVAPGQTATFTFSITAPTTTGTYNFQWQMAHGGAWFGGASTNLAIQVTTPTPPPSESATSTPLPAAAGSTSKTETIVYSDNTASWVLDQVASVTDSGGLVQSATTYDPTTALPLTVSAFGKLKSTFTYNGDGTLATVKDGNNNPTTFSNWMRGIPQSILFADSTTKSAVVNDAGWIMSVTDENGYTNSYTYDAMGRVSGITYPTGDSTTWANTTRSFVSVASAEYNLPAGHWRLTETTGNAVKITYFDALLRPVLVSEYDAANAVGTQRFVATAYDSAGRVSFTSYPSTVSNPSTGVWTLYDALGRVTSVSQDSEQNLLTTMTEYLPGFQTRVTNPRGFQVTTSYLTYDQPSTDWPLVINAPDSATTTITRDVFGKPTAITRSGGGTSVTRSYDYNPNQELCRSVEPEVGATLFNYDAAGNLASSAAGLDAGTACGAANSRTVNRSYDTRNRLLTLSFPDGVGDQSWSYTPDGLPSQVTTYNSAGNGTPVVNNYTYNHRRLLSGESSTQSGAAFSIGYGYDGNANLAANTYPGGFSVNFTNNALGQVTQATSSAGTLASGVSYYPNGAIKQFTYGNGIVHTMTQNARQLPARSTDAGVINYGFAYDGNSNPTSITDDQQGVRYNRTMSYDGLDRLQAAASASFDGDGVHRFTYDAQDNLTSWKLAGLKDYATYTYINNRLTSIQNTAGQSVVGLAYDAQGNLANKNGQAYAFDYGNRLRAGNNNQETYLYDAQGRRVASFTPAPASVPIFSAYTLNGQLLYQQDQRKHLNIPQVYLSGSVLARWEYDTATSTGVLKYEHTDALGSPVAITNQAGQVIERTNYEPYGNAIGKPNNDRVGYTGHVMDSTTGLTYMQQRYYDPTIGRFLSTDPVQANANTGASFNRYDYALNNPYKFTDPDGRMANLESDWKGDYYRDQAGNRHDCEYCLATGDEAKPSSSTAHKPNSLSWLSTGCAPTPLTNCYSVPNPDYVHAAGGASGINASITYTRNGTLFVGPAPSLSPSSMRGKFSSLPKSGKLNFGGSLTYGYLLKRSGRVGVDEYVTGGSAGFGGCYILCFGYYANSTNSAIEFGVGSAGISFPSAEYMFPIKHNLPGWNK